jgi:hypothetical protein
MATVNDPIPSLHSLPMPISFLPIFHFVPSLCQFHSFPAYFFQYFPGFFHIHFIPPLALLANANFIPPQPYFFNTSRDNFHIYFILSLLSLPTPISFIPSCIFSILPGIIFISISFPPCTPCRCQFHSSPFFISFPPFANFIPSQPYFFQYFPSCFHIHFIPFLGLLADANFISP